MQDDCLQRLHVLFSCDSEGQASGLSPRFLKVQSMILMNSVYITSLALPTLFKKELANMEATESGTAVLQCELTKPTPVEWKKGREVLKPSDKHKMRLKDTIAELTIHNLEEQDAGDYTCVCGEKTTTASLTVHGKIHKFNRDFFCHLCTHVGSQTSLDPIYLNFYDSCVNHCKYLLLKVCHLGMINGITQSFLSLFYHVN